MAKYASRVLLGVTIVALTMNRAAVAHEAEHTNVAFAFARDGSYVLNVTNDANWLLMRLESFVALEGRGPSNGAVGRPEDRVRDDRLRALAPVFVDRIVIWVDGHEVRPEAIEYVPSRSETEADRLQPLAAYRLRGHVEPGSRTMRWYYGMVADAYPITVDRADGRSDREMIVTGEAWSRTLDLSGQFAQPTRWELIREYVALGYASVVPNGAGFVLFLLGLFLLRLDRATIVRQVVPFVLAHSSGLWLTVAGVLTIPARVIGAAVALSVVYVVVENLATRELKRWRLALIPVFGVAHGAVLADRFAGLVAPARQKTVALVAFNAGVEGALLTVLLLASLGVTVLYSFRTTRVRRPGL
jgi:HupE / UreJ protein